MRQNKNTQAKLQGILHMGGCCACCGETGTDFLTLDHKQNDGWRDRFTESGNARKRSWHRGKTEGYPPEKFQVLCASCNFAKELYGECPHAVLARYIFFGLFGPVEMPERDLAEVREAASMRKLTKRQRRREQERQRVRARIIRRWQDGLRQLKQIAYRLTHRRWTILRLR